MKNNAKKSIKIGRINIPLNYWTGLAVYAVILLILAICMIVYTGSCLNLISDASNFVTGTVAVIDGGFDAFSI